MRIGIPRAMGYYYYYPFYKQFLESLGAEVVLSPPTNQKTLDSLTDCPTDEPCISVKLTFPHVRQLIEKGVDGIFLPMLISGRKDSYFCPKHIGLPAMIKNSFKLADEFLLTPRLDMHHTTDKGLSSFIKEAKKIGATSAQVRNAFQKAWEKQNLFHNITSSQQISTPEAFKVLEGKEVTPQFNHKSGIKVGIVAHSYTLYDYIGYDLVPRLREYGAVYTPEMVSPQEAIRQVENSIYDGEKLWSFELQLVGSALYWLRNKMVDKLILLGPFECGPEAIIENFLEEESNRWGVPFLILTVDEQTGEAGLMTRIEAFMDTMPVKKSEGTEGLDSLGQNKFASDSDNKQFPDPTRAPVNEKKVVGLPTMGNLGVIMSTVFSELGMETIIPPITNKTVEMGMEVAPEFICFPMVVTIGQMREALDEGANAIAMVTGKGRCRLGWYAEIQEILLRKLGYQFDMVAIDTPFPVTKKGRNFLKAINYIRGDTSWPKASRAILRGYRRLVALDAAENELFYLRAVEKNRGEGEKLFNWFYRNIMQLESIKEIEDAYQQYLNKVTSIEKVSDEDIYKIRIIGEIYAVQEKFVNLDLLNRLGNFPDQRIWVERELNTSNWFRLKVLNDRKLRKRHDQVEEAAAPYLDELVGGHGQESVGLSVLAPHEGVDGIIHLFPFTCMPEIVAQNILTRVTEENNIPLLTVITNEQTGEAGIQTRLEAFLDIVKDRKRYLKKESEIIT